MLDYIHAISTSSSLDELWDIHCAAMKKYGFDRLIYGVSHFVSANSLGPSEDLLVLSSHSPQYLKAYRDGELFRHAPMVIWASKNVGACSWSWIEENRHTFSEETLKVIKANQDLGVTAGYSLSFPETSRRSKGIIAMTAKPGLSQSDVDAIWQEHGRKLEAMNHVAHLKILSLPLQTKRSILSARQREVLEWVGDGKTNQDIATILGVTPATIEKHLRIARDKLGVETTAQAVLKTSFLNLIYTPN